MLQTPLEQFQIIVLFSLKMFSLDFSFTNLLLINVLMSKKQKKGINL